MRNKVLPSMLFGAAVAMGATTVLGLTPGTASTKSGTAGGETGSAASGPLAPDTVALAGSLPAPGPTAAPVSTTTPARPTDDGPTRSRREQAPARGAATSAPTVPAPRTPATPAPPTRRVAAATDRAPLVPEVLGDAVGAVEGTGRAVDETAEAVADNAKEVVGGAASGAPKVVGRVGDAIPVR